MSLPVFAIEQGCVLRLVGAIARLQKYRPINRAGARLEAGRQVGDADLGRAL